MYKIRKDKIRFILCRTNYKQVTLAKRLLGDWMMVTDDMIQAIDEMKNT